MAFAGAGQTLGLPPGIPANGSPPSHTYNGHPQPPVDERLEAAKNFLADEDPDRCLDFANRITQVEEYVAHIEKEDLPRSEALFRDVRVMLAAHRDWEKRRKDGPADTSCATGPIAEPFSRRLISPENAAAFEKERKAAGLMSQMREDHAPFSLHRAPDHAEFLKAMNSAAREDPDEIDHQTNLLWVESRAYAMALQDPVLIPFWMHPTEGIPQHGVTAADRIPWYRTPLAADQTTAASTRPARGWIPAYLTQREETINGLLSKRDITMADMLQLDKLMRFIEPKELYDLHIRNDNYDEDDRLGLLTPQDTALRQDIAKRFLKAQGEWMSTFNDVYFMVKIPGENTVEAQLPGVFYVEHGIAAAQRIATLKHANTLRQRAITEGIPNFSYQDTAAIVAFSQHSQPKTITDIQRRKAAILRNAGPGYNIREQLHATDRANFDNLDRAETQERTKWLTALAPYGAEFRYLRPGESEEVDDYTLYLPWELAMTPTVAQPTTIKPLPDNVVMLQQNINDRLTRSPAAPPVDITEFDMFIQIAYPELRDIAELYRQLFAKDHFGALDAREGQIWKDLKPAFDLMLTAWMQGLGTSITIKMPQPEQLPESPGVLYWRQQYATDGTPLPVPVDLATQIQALLDKGPLNINAQSGRSRLDDIAIRNLLRNFMYPALQNTATMGHGFDHMFTRWIQSLQGHRICIKVPNCCTDPDNDPSVVFFRGSLPPATYPTVSEKIMKKIRNFDPASPLQNIKLARECLPDIVQKALDRFAASQKAVDGAVYAWYLHSMERCRSCSPDPTATTSLGSQTRKLSTGCQSSIDEEVPCEHSATSNSGSSRRSSLLAGPNSARDPDLDVDLTLWFKEIKAIESEINRIAGNIRLDNKRQIYPEMDPVNLGDSRSRFFKLLQQFMPCNISRLFDAVQRHEDQVNLGKRKPTASDKKDHGSLQRKALSVYLAWEKQCIYEGVEVQLSPTRSLSNRRTPLRFLSHITDTGPAFHILAPDVAQPDITTAELKLYTFPTGSAARPIQASSIQQTQEIAGLEATINGLLSSRNDPGFTWEQSDTLLSKLRAVMPPGLAAMELEHRALDAKARTGPITPEQSEEFFASWHTWTIYFQDWIYSLNGHIVIQKGQPNDPRNAMPLVRRDFMTIPDIARPRNLPGIVAKMETDLRYFIFGDLNQLTPEERQRQELTFLQFFAPIRAVLRPMLLDSIRSNFPEHTLNEQNLSPEIEALLESLELQATGLYRLAVKESAKKVSVVENVPGEYQIQHDGTISPDRPGATEAERFTGVALSGVVNGMYDGIWREFLSLTSKVREARVFQPDEVARWKKLLYSLGAETLKTVQDKSDILVDGASKSLRVAGLTENQRTMLLDYETTFIWYRWCLNYLPPAARNNALATLPGLLFRLTDPSNVSVDRNAILPAGAPTHAEIRELEIEINNLLIRENNGSATQAQRDALAYLLRELLPAPLKVLAARVDNQNRGQLNPSTNSSNQGFGLLEAQKSLASRLAEYKNTLPPYGIFLNSWSYEQAVITAACSRWRNWKELHDNRDGTNPLPSTRLVIEDDQVKDWHDRNFAVSEYASDGCPQDTWDQLKAKLYLSVMPDVLKNHETQIRISSAAASGDITQETFLLSLKQDFAQSYMAWFSSLTSPQLESLKNQLACAGDAKEDFSGRAERRGIQRAAIEIALNQLATNQEQHRPGDRFRIVDTNRTYVPPQPEVSISLPLEPSRRRIDQDTFELTKKMVAYREWKDFDYELARDNLAHDPSLAALNADDSGAVQAPSSSIVLDAPINLHGPFALAGAADKMEAARKRQVELSRIALALSDANFNAPRPLVERMLLLITQGMDPVNSVNHPLYDDVVLARSGLDLLEEICEQSWDGEIRRYVEPFPGLSIIAAERVKERAELDEFEADVQELHDMPLWEPLIADPSPTAIDYNNVAALFQRKHDPTSQSKFGFTLDDMTQKLASIQTKRSPGQAVHLWTHEQMHKYLLVMRAHGHIHYDADAGFELVSRIPLSGHPENKYVLSREDAKTSADVYQRPSGLWRVQYNTRGPWGGELGPPIIQANKYEYLQALAFRLGRDTLRALQTIQNPQLSPAQALTEQTNSAAHAFRLMSEVTPAQRGQHTAPPTVDTNLITLRRLAEDAIREYPKIAKDTGYNLKALEEDQAGALLQMKMVEEASNNWESKFPVQEKVWDFAADRLVPETRTNHGRTIEVKPMLTQFFSMRRFPTCCQSTATQTIIKQSGPTLQTQTQTATTITTTDATAVQAPVPGQQIGQVARHIRGQQPHFPFGETPYQQAYRSFVMERELADVPEFQPPPPPRTLFNPFRRRPRGPAPVILLPVVDEPIDPNYPLPKIPAGWTPDNISIEEKRLHLIEQAKAAPGLPDNSIPEMYNTQDEIAADTARREFDMHVRQITAANDAIEKLSGKRMSQLTQPELAILHTQLGIDSRTGKFEPPPAPVKDPATLLGPGQAGRPPPPAGPARPAGRAPPVTTPTTPTPSIGTQPVPHRGMPPVVIPRRVATPAALVGTAPVGPTIAPTTVVPPVVPHLPTQTFAINAAPATLVAEAARTAKEYADAKAASKAGYDALATIDVAMAEAQRAAGAPYEAQLKKKAEDAAIAAANAGGSGGSGGP